MYKPCAVGLLVCCLGVLGLSSCIRSLEPTAPTVTRSPEQTVLPRPITETLTPEATSRPGSTATYAPQGVVVSSTPSMPPTITPTFTPEEKIPTRTLVTYSLPNAEELEVINLSNAARLEVLAEVELWEQDSPFYFDISPDGEMLALVNGPELWVMEIATGRIWNAFSTPGKLSWLGFVTYSPNGEQIAFIEGEQDIYILSATTDTVLKILNDTESYALQYFTITYSPDSELLVSCGWYAGSYTRIWDVDSGEIIQELDDKNQFQAAFSPDGAMMITSGRIGWSTIWDVLTWTPTGRIETPIGGSAYYVSFTPNGQLVAIESDWNRDEDTGITIYDVSNWEELSSTGPISSNFAFNADGGIIAFNWKNLPGELVLRATLSGERVFSREGLGIVRLEFTPDGRLLITRSSENRIQIWGIVR